MQIKQNANRAANLVRQLLAFSRQQPAERRLCDAGALMAEAMALLKAALPAGVHLEGELPEAPLPLMADPTQVVQSLINLGTNAWQALGGRSGHVRFRACRVPADATEVPRPARSQPVSHEEPAADWVCLEVADDGPGIPPELHSRIFDPFFTTKPLGEGTGLGLSVVHGMVTAHGGGVTLDSAPGRGTVFRLWLPAAVASLLPPADAPHATLPAGGAPDGTPGARVLYVDDDEVLALMVAQLLQRAGYAVTTCCDPAQALRTVAADPSAFDVLVTDLNMPEVSGLELAHAVQALRPCLPIILTSGNLPAQLGLWDGEPRPPLPFATLPKEEVAEGLVPLVARCLDGARRGH
jgi:CheY-like chemotaxis protein